MHVFSFFLKNNTTANKIAKEKYLSAAVNVGGGGGVY